MDIDPETAARLGWPKLKYAQVERERRWLCRDAPWDRIVRSERLCDLYVTGTRLRVREAVPLDGGAPTRKLGRKGDATASSRLVTSIYLDPAEYALLAALPGKVVCKVRHHLAEVPGAAGVSIDVFEDPLAGLVLAEAEFDDHESLAAFPMPDFAIREVTDDPRYSGGRLAWEGLPAE
jgi:CYTH domain-containing protein